jgi:hypothetical protein
VTAEITGESTSTNPALAVILHRMWADGSEFRWGKQAAAPVMAAA